MKKIYLMVLLLTITITLLNGCIRDPSKQISEEQAKDIAVKTAYGWDKYELYQGVTEVIISLEKQRGGDYIIHLCDLNIECMCRKDEGYWVKVKYDGSSSKIIKERRCPYG